MDHDEVEKLFELFAKSRHEPFSQLGLFINKEIKPKYYENKEKENLKKGLSLRDAHNKARQSWVVFVGGVLEKLIIKVLKDICEKHNLKITTDNHLRQRKLTKELDLVRRAIEVHFGEYSLLPDADIVVYKYFSKENKADVLVILSVKNSFRERYTETPYWKLKLSENPNTQSIKVFMVTPDNDDEVSYYNKNGKGPRKARIVMEYDLDGIYLAKENFDGSNKVRSINDLALDLKKIIK